MGYCVRYSALLRQPDETTCSEQLRKDLSYHSAFQQQMLHQHYFLASTQIIRLDTGDAVLDHREVEYDFDDYRTQDDIQSIVYSYGKYGTRIESLARLQDRFGARAEIALWGLSRAYVNNCVHQGGAWTSGLHLLWWLQRRLLEPVNIRHEDLRLHFSIKLDRQRELAEWSILMMRISFASDMGHHAQADEGISRLAGLEELAALETQTLSKRKLESWLKRRGQPLLEDALPEARYRQLAQELSLRRDRSNPNASS